MTNQNNASDNITMKHHFRSALAVLVLAGLCARTSHAQDEALPYINNYPVNRALTMHDVRELSPKGRALVRNAIYARHGRPFANATLAKFFKGKTWYRANPNWKASDENNLLSPIEKRNAKFVAATEGSATDTKNYYLDSQTLIVPGQSVGHIKLGMRRATVIGLLGQPQQIDNRADRLAQDSWYSEDLLPHVANFTLTVIYRGGKVVQIEAASIRYATANQLSVKNTLGHIRATVKPLKRTHHVFPVADGSIVTHDSPKRGLAFNFYIDGGDEEADSKPFSILVHPFNAPILPFAREAFGHGFKLSHPVK